MKETAKFLDIDDILGHSDSLLARTYKKIVSSLLKIDKINAVLSQSQQENDPLITLENAIKILDINLTLNTDELLRIPKKGPAIVIANHPTGIADAIIILKTLLSLRKDIKILANHWLQQPNCFSSLIIPVNVYDKKKRMKPVIEALYYLENDYLIFLFPAGEVSTYNFKTKVLTDKTWSLLPQMLAQKVNAPVIPIHIAGGNNLLFYLLGAIHPFLRTSKLPGSLFNKNNLNFHLRIGQPIVKNLLQKSAHQGHLLYDLTYALPHIHTVEKKFSTQKILESNYKPIQTSINTDLIVSEIKNIPQENCILQKNHYSVFLIPTSQIPHTLQQIGIEREHAFRAANMGTGTAIDIDRYDHNYEQLFIWDHEHAKIAGGYRLKLTSEKDLTGNFSASQSYLASLYDIDHTLQINLPPFLEMGRSFVALPYQRTKILLSLLLKGIAKTVIQHLSQVKMATGLVSFSLDSNHERINQILLEYLYAKSLLSPPWMKKLKPVDAYKHDSTLPLPLKNIAQHASNMVELEKQLAYLFNERIKLPSLFKLYECIGAQIGTISIDKNFSNCIDVIYYWKYCNSDFARLALYFDEEDLRILKKNAIS